MPTTKWTANWLTQQMVTTAHMVCQDVAVKAVVVPHFLDVVIFEECLESMKHSFLLILHSRISGRSIVVH